MATDVRFIGFLDDRTEVEYVAPGGVLVVTEPSNCPREVRRIVDRTLDSLVMGHWPAPTGTKPWTHSPYVADG